MDVYTLDSLYRRQQVVENYESFIWTERFRAAGDFEIMLPSTLENRNLLPIGTKLAHSKTRRVAVVETIEDITDDEQRLILKVKGRTLEYILDSRLARGTLGDLTTTPKWILTGLPAAVARQLFHDICVTGILDSGDIIPSIVEGSSLFPDDTIDEPTDSISYEIDMMTLYQALTDLCNVYDMGYRIVRGPDTSIIYFDVYTGCDRTTGQTTLPAIVFSLDMDNLKNTRELTTTALYKNVAYVISPVGHEVVYAQDVDPSVSGFDRRALFIKADDITDTDPGDASDKMIQRGKEELAKARPISAFDGEIDQDSGYRYGIDFNLGDLVERQNGSGSATIMRVTEQIFVSDKEDDKEYPTLSVYEFVTEGSWDSWAPDEDWDEVDEELDWDEA